MNTESDQQPATDDIVTHKVQRRVAKKVLKDIHRQVDDIEQQVEEEKRASGLILPISLIIVLAIIVTTFWPELMRLVSALIQPS